MENKQPEWEKEKTDLMDAMKFIICEHENLAYKDFREDSGYWKHGEMRDIGVVADRILKEAEPIIEEALSYQAQKTREEVIEEFNKTKVCKKCGQNWGDWCPNCKSWKN